MLHKRLLSSLLMVFLYGVTSSSHAMNAYTVQILPQLFPAGEGGAGSRYAKFEGLLNDKGQITAVMDLGKYYKQPVIWSSGQITGLGDVYGISRFINNSGQVVISANVVVGAPETGSCYFWSDGALKDMGSLGGGLEVGCWPAGLNASGQVIGVSIVLDRNGIYRGRSVFLWSNGKMVNLDTFENGRYSEEPNDCKGGGYFYGLCPTAVNDAAVDINDNGQVLFLRNNASSRAVPIPPPSGPVVWSNGVTIPLPQSVSFGIGKSINNRGDVLGYINDKSFLIWNVNNGAIYQYDSDYSLGVDSNGGAKLTEQGEVYFPRADGIYKLTQNHTVQQVVGLGVQACKMNQLAAVNEKGLVIGLCDGVSYTNQNGLAASLNSLLPPEAGVALSTILSFNEAGQILAMSNKGQVLLTPVIRTTASCDVNLDHLIDADDLAIIYAANRTANPAYDLDGDGMVTIKDLRKCVLQCSKTNCAA